MAEIEIHASQWRLVEVGRVVLFTHGIYKDRLAVIVEIIDHKRVRSLPILPQFFSSTTIKSTKPPTLGPRRWPLKRRTRQRPPPIRRPQQPHRHTHRDSKTA